MKVNVKTERAGLCPAPTKVIRITLDSAFLLGNYPQTPATFKRQVERLKQDKTRTPAPPGARPKKNWGGRSVHAFGPINMQYTEIYVQNT